MSKRLTSDQREEWIAGMDKMVREYRRKGMKLYYINFMFNQLPGKEVTRKEIMKQEVTRVHDILTRNIVRKPQSQWWMHLRPIVVGCPDFPIYRKDKKVKLRDATVNDGMHYNAIVIVPKKNPYRRKEDRPDRLANARLSRLHVGLKRHFEGRSRFYVNDRLYRINVTPIKKGTMAGYTFKAFRDGRIGNDDISAW